MSSSPLTLDLVTQESRLFTLPVKQITVDTDSGEITLLPGHVPLVTRLTEGLLRYLDLQNQEHVLAIFGGFLELDSDGVCSILADSAVRAEDIDLAKVEQARQEAQAILNDQQKARDFALAEAALRHATLELKAAQRRNRHRSA